MAKRKKSELCCRLSIKALAVAVAALWGGYLFLLGILTSAGISGFWFSPEILALLATIYPGLAATAAGAFIGLVWGLVCGAICGAITAWLHNFTMERMG